MRLASVSIWLLVASLVAFCLPAPTAADLELVKVDWNTEPGPAPVVRFQLQFYNPGPETSELVAGELLAQKTFGAYLYNEEVSIGTYDIPPIPPESFFDVFFDSPLNQLPRSAEEIHPTDGVASEGVWTVAQGDTCCLPDDHWDGNVDVLWSGPGGSGQVFKHIGTLYVCPGAGNSYIHVVTECAGNASWAINGLCAGFSATLVNEDFTAAPNPVPPNWTGWICVSAGSTVPVGTVCCFTVDFTCLNQTATIDLCATACPSEPTATDPTTWGRIKALYK